MKKSTVKSFSVQDSWANDYGTFWPHEVHFDNGEVVTFNKKARGAYTVGEEVAYTSSETEYGLKGKQHKMEDWDAQNGGQATRKKSSSFDSTGAMVGNAITNAISMYNAGKIPWEKVEVSADQICEISNRLKQKHS